VIETGLFRSRHPTHQPRPPRADTCQGKSDRL